MTAQFARGNGAGSSYAHIDAMRQPVVEQGIVVYNATRPKLDIATRKKVAGRKRSFYEMDGDERDAFTVVPGELVFSKRRKVNSGLRGQTAVPALSGWNGLGRDNQSREQVQADMEFAGVARGGARHDPDSPEYSFATQIGGLRTIVNTGNRIIQTGNYIQWQAPPGPNDGINPRPWLSQTGVPSTKLLAWTVPYDPRDSTASVKAVLQQARGLVAGDLQDRGVDNTPLRDAGVAVVDHARTAALLGVHALLEAGVIQLTANGADVGTGEAARKETAAAQRWLDGKEAGEAGTDDSVARQTERLWALAGAKVDSTEFAADSSGPDGSNNVERLIMETYFGQDRRYLVAPRPLTKRGPAQTPLEQVDAMQRSNLGNLMAGLAAARFDEVDRIFAKAYSTGKPGEGIDTKLGGLGA